MTMNIYEIFLLKILMKQKLNLFYKYEHTNKTNFFEY